MAAISVESIRLYEQPALLEAVGSTIRPGGLALTDHAIDLCRLPVGARVLDIGCGQGASVEHLIEQRRLKAIGVDVSSLLLTSGRERCPHLPLAQATGGQLPFASERFDAVLMECSLSVMPNAGQALDEVWRVLAPDGVLIVSDMYSRQPDVTAGAPLPIDTCLSGALPETAVRARIERQGFLIDCWEDHTPALKVFAAQLIWSHGSLGQFWCRAAAGADGPQLQEALAQVRPGYFLLIAHKQGT